MARPVRPRAAFSWVWGHSVLAGVLFSLTEAPLLWPQATDLVDVAKLGQRGVSFLPPLNALLFGSIGGIGDFNGDGFGDVAFGISDALVVVYGRPGVTGEVTLSLEGAFPGSVVLRGLNGVDGGVATVNPAGDLNGDGYGDLLSGFPSYQLDLGVPIRGIGFVLYGGPQIQGEVFVERIGDTVPGVLLTSSDPISQFGGIGYAVTMVGDVNGDGRPDLAISAPDSTVTEDGQRDPLHRYTIRIMAAPRAKSFVAGYQL